MAWITLALRKQELKAQINQYDMQLLTISRETRQIARNKMTDTSIFNMEKQRELREAREGYTSIRDEGRPEDINSRQYKEWRDSYDDARQEYLEQKEEIEDRYDIEMEMIEQEASDRQAALEQEQTMIETQLAALRAEYESVQQEVTEEIKSSAIKFE